MGRRRLRWATFLRKPKTAGTFFQKWVVCRRGEAQMMIQRSTNCRGAAMRRHQRSLAHSVSDPRSSLLQSVTLSGPRTTEITVRPSVTDPTRNVPEDERSDTRIPGIPDSQSRTHCCTCWTILRGRVCLTHTPECGPLIQWPFDLSNFTLAFSSFLRTDHVSLERLSNMLPKQGSRILQWDAGCSEKLMLPPTGFTTDLLFSSVGALLTNIHKMLAQVSSHSDTTVPHD